LHDGPKMFPAAGPARWTALRRQALGDGILDAALLCRYENAMRPGQFHWPEWEQGQMAKITRGLDALEREAESLDGVLDIGSITIGCALGYLDFRFGGMEWRRSRPKLSAWYGGFAKRPSMQETVPPQ
ncbi:MAG TPA: glutathione S-transferase C-terminal domain-containing protein, partial [Alphaproteobacteria bacterium]|nr:glutathione S-transferase C-terminal domain-containing protein [Alphaproteobacteria bacterium]